MVEWSQRIPLTAADVKKYVPYTPGVYRLTNEVEERQFVFYVGQTEDLGRELMAHLTQAEPKECIREHVGKYDCSFRFAELDSAEERAQEEKRLLGRYRPFCNG